MRQHRVKERKKERKKEKKNQKKKKKKEREKEKEKGGGGGGGRKKSSVSIQTILVLFVLAEATWAVINEKSDIIPVVCYTHFPLFWAPTKTAR